MTLAASHQGLAGTSCRLGAASHRGAPLAAPARHPERPVHPALGAGRAERAAARAAPITCETATMPGRKKLVGRKPAQKTQPLPEVRSAVLHARVAGGGWDGRSLAAGCGCAAHFPSCRARPLPPLPPLPLAAGTQPADAPQLLHPRRHRHALWKIRCAALRGRGRGGGGGAGSGSCLAARGDFFHAAALLRRQPPLDSKASWGGHSSLS